MYTCACVCVCFNLRSELFSSSFSGLVACGAPTKSYTVSEPTLALLVVSLTVSQHVLCFVLFAVLKKEKRKVNQIPWGYVAC